MAKRPEELTIDFRKLLKLTFVDRVNMAKSDIGQQYLSALTPSQLAELFPDYYKRQLPSKLASAASGGVPMAGAEDKLKTPEGVKPSATPEARTEPKVSPKESPEVKKSWQQKLEEWGGEPKSGAVLGPLKDVRSKLFEQMKDPKIRNAVLARIEIEVGNQGPQAQQAFLESIANRAAARGMSLYDVVSNKDGYYPVGDNSKWRSKQGSITDKIIEKYQGIVSDVSNGSNIANFATGNSSGDVGFGQGKARRMPDGSYQAPGQTASYGGERFGVEASDIKWAKEQAKAEAEAKKKLEEATAVPVPPNQNVPAGATPQPGQTGYAGGTGLRPEDTGAGQVQPQQVTTVIPPLPSGLNNIVMDHYNSLKTEQEKEAFRRNVHNAIKNKNISVDQINKEAEQSNPQAQGTESSATPLPKNKKEANKVIADITQGKIDINSRVVDSSLGVLGLHEQKDKEKIKAFLGSGNIPGDIATRDGAWCGAFVNASLRDAGLKGLGKSGFVASTWQTWGEAKRHADVSKGDILVQAGGRGPGQTGGHVGIATGNVKRDKNGNIVSIQMRSGNQKDRITDTWVSPDSISHVRRATEREYTDELKDAIKKTQIQPQAVEGVDPNVDRIAQATAVSPPPVDQKVAPGQTPAAGQTGTTAQTPPIPGGAQPQPEQKAPEPPKPTAEPTPEISPAPGFAGGGEIPKQDLRPNENAYVVKADTGSIVAQMNTDRETLRRNPDTGKAEVNVVGRTDPKQLEAIKEDRQIAQNNYAEDTRKQQEAPVAQPNVVSMVPTGNENLRDMYAFQTQGNISEIANRSPSYERVMERYALSGRSNDYGTTAYRTV